MMPVTVIGAGLAGCEAALQCARQGVPVRLYEMRPKIMTPAHQTGEVAELVCSNSLKSEEITNAHGLLKAELKIYGSFLLQCAERAKIPGGKALVVDRRRFSEEVTNELTRREVEIVREEVKEVPDAITIIATGPLTSEAMAQEMKNILGTNHLFYYDAIAPIVAAESLNMEKMFWASRYGKGNDYLNAPLTEDEYDRLVEELARAELHPVHDFEKIPFFEGCLPIEELAKRDRLALAYGPLKPVGLVDSQGRKKTFAVVQLRKENAAGTMFNLVGFQTRLRRAEQERVFRMIPGLEQAVFLRYGSIHRNTFLNAPAVLLPTLQTKFHNNLFVAGQLTGVEGYVEAIATGLIAGINAAKIARGEMPVTISEETILGALLNYITTPHPNFQPMNANFGLLPPLSQPAQGLKKKLLFAARSLSAVSEFYKNLFSS